jgi:uncharacterized protein (DUF58 family)
MARTFRPENQPGMWWRPRRGSGTEKPRLVDPTLEERRPLYVIVGFLIVLALALRQPLLVSAALLVAVLALVPEVWYRFGARGLRIERRPATRQALFGDFVDLTLTIENRQLLPLPWVAVADTFPEALPVTGAVRGYALTGERVVVSSTVGLWAYQRVRRRLRVRCVSRGAFWFGPLRLRLTDPFGLLTREVALDLRAQLLVYPLVVPIERLGLPANSAFGERKSALRLLEDPLRVAGMREYEPGDEPRRIHWKATARTGTLQSKLYEPATRQVLAIFVDVRTYQRLLFGYDPELAELAVTVAASVASWGLGQGIATGMYGNSSLAVPEESAVDSSVATPAPDVDAGDDAARRLAARQAGALRLRVPPASNPAQLPRVLEGLARLLPFGALPMEAILASEQGRLPVGSTIVYVGAEAAVDVPLIVALRRAKASGHAVTLLLTGPPADESAGESPVMHLAGLTTHRIGGRETWSSLVAAALKEREPGDEHGESVRAGAVNLAARDGALVVE